jgi:DNA-binding MarR family transcriptional regulator
LSIIYSRSRGCSRTIFTRFAADGLIKKTMRSSNLISRQIGRQSKRQKQRIGKTAAQPAESSSETADKQDSIEHLLTEWRRERPDLDPWALGVFGRVRRLSTDIVRRAEAWLRPLDLTFESFSVIVTLRRSGPPYELNPTALYRDSLLSSGAITNRIDRVESAGLVKRRPDPNDRRGVIVQLTPKGRALADRAIAQHFSGMTAALTGLEPSERRQLTVLLAKLLASVETQNRSPTQPLKRRSQNQGRKNVVRKHNERGGF